jgi:hypothetical protein
MKMKRGDRADNTIYNPPGIVFCPTTRLYDFNTDRQPYNAQFIVCLFIGEADELLYSKATIDFAFRLTY